MTKTDSQKNNNWKRWLSANEIKALGTSEHQLVIDWAKRLVIERLKLAKARGMLYSVKFKDYTDEELDQILEDTKGDIR